VTVTQEKPASWVIVDLETGRALYETFSAATVANIVNPSRYRAVPILEYLQTLNATIRESA